MLKRMQPSDECICTCYCTCIMMTSWNRNVSRWPFMRGIHQSPWFHTKPTHIHPVPVTWYCKFRCLIHVLSLLYPWGVNAMKMDGAKHMIYENSVALLSGKSRSDDILVCKPLFKAWSPWFCNQYWKKNDIMHYTDYFNIAKSVKSSKYVTNDICIC